MSYPTTLHTRPTESPRVPTDVDDVAVLAALAALPVVVAVLASHPAFTSGAAFATAIAVTRGQLRRTE